MSNALSLDELFGVKEPIEVIWGGKRYTLTRREAMGPRDIVRWQQLMANVTKIRNAVGKDTLDDGDVDEALANQLDDTIDSAIKLIGPKLPLDEMPFLAKVQIIEFYSAQYADSDAGESEGPKE